MTYRRLTVLMLLVFMAGCGERPASDTDRPGPAPTLADTIFVQEVSWSPDGGQLVMSVLGAEGGDFTYRIYRIPSDGGDLAALTPGPRDLWTSWSPDGRRIAFASERGGNTDIYAMRADGSDWIRLTEDPATDTHPSWSPNGSQIAFVSHRGGEPALYVMASDGSNQRRLAAVEGVEVWNPVWSPDGERLAFYGTRAGGEDHVYVVGVDGSGRERLATGVWPGWSPDGSRIIFGAPEGIALMAPDGTERTVWHAGDAGYARFSPDGSRIAYVVKENGHVLVVVAGVDGSGRETLLERPAPQW